MKFKKLHIQNFKCFRDRTVEFSDGLNIIYGPNESGKSSIYQALVLSLFGFSTRTRKAHFGNLKRDDFIPLDTGIKPKIALTFLRGNSTYSIVQDFTDNSVQINSKIGTSEESQKKFKTESAREYVKGLLGGIDEEIFQKYASISHYELSRLDAAKYKEENEDMGEVLIKMVESSRGEGIINIGGKIDKRLKSIRDEIIRLNQNISTKNEELNRAKSIESKLGELKKQHYEISASLNEKQKRYDELKAIVERVTSRLQSEKVIQDFEKQIARDNEDFKRLSDIISENENLNNQIKNFPSEIRNNHESILKELDKYYDDEKAITAKKNLISEQVENYKKELADFQSEYNSKYSNVRINSAIVSEFREREAQKFRLESESRVIEREVNFLSKAIDEGKAKRAFFINLSLAAVLIAIIILTVGFVIPLRSFLPFMLFITVVFASIAIILYLRGNKSFDVSLLEEHKKKSAELASIEAKIAENDSILTQLANKTGFSSRQELEDFYNQMQKDNERHQILIEKLTNLQNELKKLEQDFANLSIVKSAILEKTGFKTLIDLEKSIEECKDLLKRKSESDYKIEKDNIRSKLDSLTSQIAISNVTLQKMKEDYEKEFPGQRMNEEEFAKIKKEFSLLESEIPYLSNEKINLEGQIKAIESDLNYSVEELNEQIDRIRNLESSLENEINELEYIKDILEIIEKEYKYEFLPELEKRALELFKVFAGNSDKRFSLENWPEIKIFSQNLKNFREIHLSQGTRDQLYFALRIAWSDILTPEDLKLPLLWDDPFVYWDSERTEGICRIAYNLVKCGHQVIVFTHREDLLESFSKIFSKDEINLISLIN